MAGHSKWKQIKHKKAINDGKRSKHFTKLIKEITVAARSGGGDPAGNARLRFLLEKGRDINMPLDNALRAIKKGTGELPGVSYEEYTYEGFGPGGIAVIIEVLTDNKNKAIADLRQAFSRNGGNVAEGGAVGWMFERLGSVEASGSITEDALIEALIEHDVKDVKLYDDRFVITCEPRSLDVVKQAITDLGLKVHEARLEYVAKEPLILDAEAEEKAIAFMDVIEDLEDVQHVYTNMA